MTPDEFTEWAADVSRRFPDTGEFLGSRKGRDVLRLWFADFFHQFEYEDALRANYELMTEGAIGRWDRDKLFRIFAKRVQEIDYQRKQQEAKAASQPTQALKRIKHDERMGPMYRYVMRKMDAWKSENPTQKRLPTELIEQWTAEAARKYDP